MLDGSGIVPNASPDGAVSFRQDDGGSQPLAHDLARDSALIGGSGGRLALETGLTLDVPAQAVTEDAQITASETRQTPPPGVVAYSPIYRFEPDGMVFSKPVTVTLPFEGDPAQAKLFWTREGSTEWEQLPSTVDGQVLRATVTHFSSGFVGTPSSGGGGGGVSCPAGQTPTPTGCAPIPDGGPPPVDASVPPPVDAGPGPQPQTCRPETCPAPPAPRCDGNISITNGAPRCSSKGKCIYPRTSTGCRLGCVDGLCGEDAGACRNFSTSSCTGGDGCCPAGCTAASDSDCFVRCAKHTCAMAPFTVASSGQQLSYGLGYPRRPADPNAGWPQSLPSCTTLSGTVRIPVLLVDWYDFDPRTQGSNRNNPANTGDPSYAKGTPAQISAFLNGPDGPARYYRDVSGGQLALQFEVYGWLRSSPSGTYLKSRASYEYSNPALNGRWDCKRMDLMKDALRDAIATHGLDLTKYDADCNGVVDGAALVYEGGPGLCAGTRLSGINDTLELSNGIRGLDPRTLVVASDPNAPRFAGQQIVYLRHINVSETDTTAWLHELAHLLLGVGDTYYPPQNMATYALSAKGHFTHPAAWEKWLYARWIRPTELQANGTYSLRSHDIPDGTSYNSGPYVNVVYLDDTHKHFLTVENRWFGSWPGTAGQPSLPATRWLDGDVESGLTIVEVNYTQAGFDAYDQDGVHRYAPPRAANDPYEKTAFRAGDVFSHCFGQRCVTIRPTTAPGPVMSFSLELTTAPSGT